MVVYTVRGEIESSSTNFDLWKWLILAMHLRHICLILRIALS